MTLFSPVVAGSVESLSFTGVAGSFSDSLGLSLLDLVRTMSGSMPSFLANITSARECRQDNLCQLLWVGCHSCQSFADAPLSPDLSHGCFQMARFQGISLILCHQVQGCSVPFWHNTEDRSDDVLISYLATGMCIGMFQGGQLAEQDAWVLVHRHLRAPSLCLASAIAWMSFGW